MPSARPSARTDCPSTASRRDGQQTRHESGTPCPMPQESTTRPAPRPDGHAAARRPYAASLPAQIEQTEPAGEPRASRGERGREQRETGRNSEDLRPLACRIAAQVIKASNPARSQPDRSQRRRPAGTPPATVPSSSPVSASARCQFCFWRVCRTPARFRPSADEQRHPRPPAWTPPAPGEPSHFRARSVSHETAQYLHSITYAPYPHFSLGNNLDDSPTVNELNSYLQNHIFGLTTPVFLSTLYNSPRLQSYSSPIATKKTNILIDFRPQIW